MEIDDEELKRRAPLEQLRLVQILVRGVRQAGFAEIVVPQVGVAEILTVFGDP